MNTTAPVIGPFPGYYQVAYVTTDLDRAMSLFGETHGVHKYFEMRDLRYQTGPGREAHCDIGLAYLGATEIEIIQPLDGDVQLYRDFLPQEGFGVRFHHVCRLFASEPDFDRQIEAYTKRDMKFPIMGAAPGNSRYFYCDFRAELGHYIEGIVFDPAASDWLATIPRN